MVGIDRNTFQPIAESDRILQAARDVLRTPKGSRVLRRNYGSRLAEFVDRNNDSAQVALLNAEAVRALETYVPELRVSRANASGDGKNLSFRIESHSIGVIQL